MFRIFYRPLATDPSVVYDIVLFSCCLHNLIRGSRSKYGDNVELDAEMEMPKHNMIPLRLIGGNSSLTAFHDRNMFKNYFNSRSGSVSWQLKNITQLDVE